MNGKAVPPGCVLRGNVYQGSFSIGRFRTNFRWILGNRVSSFSDSITKLLHGRQCLQVVPPAGKNLKSRGLDHPILVHGHRLQIAVEAFLLFTCFWSGKKRAAAVIGTQAWIHHREHGLKALIWGQSGIRSRNTP